MLSLIKLPTIVRQHYVRSLCILKSGSILILFCLSNIHHSIYDGVQTGNGAKLCNNSIRSTMIDVGVYSYKYLIRSIWRKYNFLKTLCPKKCVVLCTLAN